MDIAEAMSDEETLWLAAARFDDRSSVLDELDAASIITRSSTGASIGFRHQTLFDHALARMFVKQRGKLSSYVLERQPSLFIRPKLWAALSYLRVVEPHAYQEAFEAIWNADGLRPHLRILLIDFLGYQNAPLDFEEKLLLPLLLKGEQRGIAFRAVAGSKGWFERLAHSAIATAMAEPPKDSWLVEPVIHAAWAFSPDKVVEFLEKFWISNPEYDTHTWVALDDCPSWSSKAIALVSRILKPDPGRHTARRSLGRCRSGERSQGRIGLGAEENGFRLGGGNRCQRAVRPIPRGRNVRGASSMVRASRAR